MKEIKYTITDPLGIHARPAGQLVKAASVYKDSDIKITVNGKTVDAKRIMGVMQLGAKQGHTLSIAINGGDEDAAAAGLEKFLKENL